MVANIAIELQAMRLITYKAAARAAQGKDFSREVALARKICADKGTQIGLDGVKLLGGHGFVKEHPVERWYRDLRAVGLLRSEEHTSELQSLMRISYAVFCLKKKNRILNKRDVDELHQVITS